MTAEAGSAFTILIETGLHAGTVQRLAPGMYTLGSELDADIILSDSDVKPIHLILELDQHGVRLEPLQGGIMVDGEGVALEPGGERHLSCPVSFTIGDALIKVTAPADVAKARRHTRALVGIAGVVIAAVLGFQVLGAFTAPDIDGLSAMQSPDQLSNEMPDQPEAASRDQAAGPGTIDALEEQQNAAPGSETATAAQPDVTLDQAAAALRDRLAADELTDIKVKTAGDRLMVRGEATPDRMDDWQDIRIWFDGAYGRHILMVASVDPAEEAEPPKLAIEAVWSGEEPYLIAGGQRFFVGNPIGEGWIIEQIASNEIKFKRGDKSFSLTL